MAISYNGATQTARMNAVLSAIDANASPATLEIGTTAMGSVLVTITLSDPSFAVSGTPAVLTMAGVPKSGVAGAAGTAAAARIKDGGGTAIVTGLTVTATGGGGDITLNSITIASSQTVTINSATLTHPA